MPSRRKRRPNWPYRLAWLASLGTVVLYLVVQTWLAAMAFGERAHGMHWEVGIVAACLHTTVALMFVGVGASLGSFLNVVAYRLPLGRYIGGHSACPYCQTPIEGIDNVPVFAWLKLRGRCRTCRLPISIQYPLVELTTAVIFLLIFLSEFATSGANLPNVALIPKPEGLTRVSVTPTLVLRIVTYLAALSGLVAAALIAVRGKTVPMKLYLWSLLPWCVACAAQPKTVVVPWREAQLTGVVDTRLDCLATLICGAVAGLLVARCIAPILYPNFDRSLLSSDRGSVSARQTMGAMALVGCLLGWQAAVPFGWVLLVSGCLAVICCRTYRHTLSLSDATVWMWLGLVVFRIGWQHWSAFSMFPESWPSVLHHVLGALLLAPLATVFRHLAVGNPSSTNAVRGNEVDDEDDAVRNEDIGIE